MVKFCLKLGSIDKKLIMIIISTILYFIMYIIERFSNMSQLHAILDGFYSRGISYIIIIIVPLIQKCRNKELILLENRRSCKQITLDLFYIYLMRIIVDLLAFYLTLLKAKSPEDTEDYKMSHYEGLCSEVSLEIIFIVIVSKFLLKIKLHIHHYIGIFIFIILSLGIDLLCDLNIFKPDIFFIFIYIFRLIIDSIYATYEKYMMDKLGYSPYFVVFSIGFIFLLEATVSAIIFSFMDNGDTILSLENYFDKEDYKEVILHMIYLIAFRFFVNILKILTAYYFTPIHIFTSYTIIKVFNLFLEKDEDIKYYSLILFIFQFLALLIFLEIIELNFLNLNKNTKRNIQRRQSEENILFISFQEKYIEEKEEIMASHNNYLDMEMTIVSDEDSVVDERKTDN